MDIRTRIGFILRPVRLHHMEVDGKKLLVIIKCGLRGGRVDQALRRCG